MWRELKLKAKENGATVNRTMTKSPRISNCCVASDYSDLGKILEDEDLHGVPRKRKAAHAVVGQDKIHRGGSANDPEADSATGEESEGDSNFSESRRHDADFPRRKRKVKNIKN